MGEKWGNELRLDNEEARHATNVVCRRVIERRTHNEEVLPPQFPAKTERRKAGNRACAVICIPDAIRLDWMTMPNEELPSFKYIPDLHRAKAVEASDSTCPCCEKARGWMCTGCMYGESDVELVCPWCVADGSAAAKFEAYFNDVCRSKDEDPEPDIRDCFQHRTPGVPSYQDIDWPVCCRDMCLFLGAGDTKGLEEALEAARVSLKDFDWIDVREMWSGYLLLFECGQCHKPHPIIDMD